MKILKKIKWGIGASILVVVMGSCVKDPDFGMTNAVWYMLQKNRSEEHTSELQSQR